MNQDKAPKAIRPQSTHIRIEVVANGYVVYEGPEHRMTEPCNVHVFESFHALTAWLKKGLVQR